MTNRRDVLLIFYKRRSGSEGPLSRIDPRVAAYFVLMTLLIGLAGWLYLARSTEVASYAHDIRLLQSDQERLHREIVVLQGQVADLGSLDRVLDAGQEWGYRLPDATDTARRMQLPYQPPAATPTPTASGTALWPESEKVPQRSVLGEWWRQFETWLNEPADAGDP